MKDIFTELLEFSTVLFLFFIWSNFWLYWFYWKLFVYHSTQFIFHCALHCTFSSSPVLCSYLINRTIIMTMTIIIIATIIITTIMSAIKWSLNYILFVCCTYTALSSLSTDNGQHYRCIHSHSHWVQSCSYTIKILTNVQQIDYFSNDKNNSFIGYYLYFLIELSSSLLIFSRQQSYFILFHLIRSDSKAENQNLL